MAKLARGNPVFELNWHKWRQWRKGVLSPSFPSFAAAENFLLPILPSFLAMGFRQMLPSFAAVGGVRWWMFPSVIAEMNG
jgi:hypothetical protein